MENIESIGDTCDDTRPIAAGDASNETTSCSTYLYNYPVELTGKIQSRIDTVRSWFISSDDLANDLVTHKSTSINRVESAAAESYIYM